MKIKNFDLKDTWTLAIFLVGCFVLVAFARSIYTVAPELGGDALRKWISAKVLADTGDFEELIRQRHHSARWGSNFPLAVLIKISGFTITNYMLLPLLLYAGMYTMMISFAVRKPFQVAALFVLAVFLFYEPMFFRASSQTQPFVFGIFYLTVALWAMNRYLEKGKLWLLLFSALFAFFAYGAKETYVFFYPGLFLLLLMRGRFRDCIIYAVALLFLLFLETLVFNAVSSGLTLGRIEYLATGHHLKAMDKKASFGGYPVWEFLSRRWLAITPFNQFISAVATGYFLFLVFTRRLSRVDTLSLGIFLMVISYSFVMTFIPFKLKPLLSIQPLHQKYMATIMPYFIYCSVYALNDILGSLQQNRKKAVSYTVVAVTAVFLVYAVVKESPFKYEFRYTFPVKDAFPWKQDQYIKELNEKWDAGYGFCVKRWRIRHNVFFWLETYLDQDRPGKEYKWTVKSRYRIMHSPDYSIDELKGYIQGWELNRILALEQCDMSRLE